ncbi:hypothetical protein R1sor_024760 [Riccia sorocarpa]|uniref:RING-type E3 ubiquitin transferase n=1 Tax=Riccia sorocarpa TaxID=122646 RepID=A0ABD3GVE0_9MARC
MESTYMHFDQFQAFEAIYEATRFLPCLMVLCFSARSLIGPPEYEVDFTWSPEKIKEALKEIEFTKSGAGAPVRESGDKDCTICLSEFVEGESLYMFPDCNHVFHKACLSQWLLRNKTTCPICRSSLKIKQQQFEEEDPQFPSGIPFQDLYSPRSVRRNALGSGIRRADHARNRASHRAIRAPDRIYGRDPVPDLVYGRYPAQMTKRKRPPQAPPATAARKKNARGTTEHASSAGPSRPKKGGRRGEPKEPVDPNAIEGQYLVELEVIPDPDRHIRWGHVTRDQRRAAMRSVRRFELTSRGLLDALTLPVHRPHMTACLEFIQSAVTVGPRESEGRERLDLPMEGTVRGQTVRLDAILVRQAFVLPKAEMEIKRQVRHCLIRDWFPDYQRSGKRYIARTCLYPEWAPALECISMVLLASRRPRTIPGRLIYYIKNKEFDRECEPEERLDFADLMAHSLRREVFAVQAHLAEHKPERYMETFVAIPLTWILIHLGIITGEECDALPAAPAPPAVPAAPTGPSSFLEGLRKRCRIIVWSRASLKLLTAILEAMVLKGYLPSFLLDREVCTVWGGDHVETIHPLTYPTHHVKLKSFQRLYDHGICLRNVLLVDTLPERNSRNHPYSAVHPLALDATAFEPKTSAWLVRFGKWLETWTESLLPTVEFMLVEEAPAEEGTRVEEAQAVEEAHAVKEVPAVEEAAVKEAPAVQEAAVEEAPTVEEAAVEEPTPVELGATHE